MELEAVTQWLEGLLDSYVKPDPQEAAFHQSILDLRMQEMKERLPEINKVFDGVQLEMAGSVLNSTKVGQSDEFDANVVIKLPFDEKYASLTFDKSSPGYALLEISKDVVRTVQEDHDIFVEHNNAFFVSAEKLDVNLRMAIFQELNSLNTSGSSSSAGFRETLSFDSDSCPDILVYKCEGGWEYIVQRKKFSLDLAICIHLPVSVLKDHPTIPDAIKRIQTVFPDITETNFVRLVPKTSPRFSNTVNADFPEKIKVSDWVLGFGGIENQILKKFDTPSKCLMLLKYMICNHDDLPLWSYYLKTLVVQMVIDKPDKDFWSGQNLFSAFKACLERLYQAVQLTDLYDTFDNRLKLLQISLVDKRCHGEERYWLEKLETGLKETSRKLISADAHKTITLKLQHLTTELNRSTSKGSEATIEFLKTDLFKIKRYQRLWKKEEIQFINKLEKRPGESRWDKKTELISTSSGTVKFSGTDKKFKFLVAEPEARERWNSNSKWEEYNDENEEWEKFKKNITSSRFQSNMFTFRTEFFDEPVVEAACAWCGRQLRNNRHIFWECEHSKVFWEEYLNHVVNKDYFGNTKDVEDAVMSQMKLGACFKEDREKISLDNHRKHLTRLAKSYLLVCHRIGVLPLHREHWSQISACQNRPINLGSSIGGYKHQWMKCPLAPPIGRS